MPHVKNADFVRRMRFADGSSVSTQPDLVCIEKKIFFMDLLNDLINQSGILNDMHSPVNDIDDDYCIDAYLTWEQRLVQITYPSKNNKWLRRVDCGSYSQFRWSLYDENLDELVQIVVKHSSCLNSVFTQPICKNCEFRHVWHQSCTTPSNVFYIMAVGKYEACGNLLEPLILSRIDISDECIDAYEESKPRPLYKVKSSSCPKNKKLLDLEKGIEQAVYKANQQRRKYYIDGIAAQHKLGTFINDLTPDLLQYTIPTSSITNQAKLRVYHSNQTDCEGDKEAFDKRTSLETLHDSSSTSTSLNTFQDSGQCTIEENIQDAPLDTHYKGTESQQETYKSHHHDQDKKEHKGKHKKEHKSKHKKHKKKHEQQRSTHKDVVQDDSESDDFGCLPIRPAFFFTYIDPNPK